MLELPKTAKKIISPALYLTGAYPRRWHRSTVASPMSVVLCYHRVNGAEESAAHLFNVERGVTAKLFEAQIRLMLRHFVPIKPSEILAATDSNRLRFAVTFDDGYHDNYQIAAPILKRLGVPAAFYVVSDFVGTDRRFWWEQLAAMLRATPIEIIATSTLPAELTSAGTLPATLNLRSHSERETAHKWFSAALMRLPHREILTKLQQLASLLDVSTHNEGRDFPLMDWQQLRDLHGQGFEIGGHTATHCNLGKADDAEIAREVTQSLVDTQNQLGEEVQTFAFPYGRAAHQSTAAYEALRAAGIRAAFSTEKGIISEGAAQFALPRIALNGRWPFGWLYNVDQAVTIGKPAVHV